MKKKILTAVLLVVCMVFSMVLVSCGDDEPSAIDVFETAIENTNPEKIDGSVIFSTVEGPLELKFSAVIAADGKFTVDYEYTRFNGIEGAANEYLDETKGTVTSEDEGILSNVTAAALALDLGADMEYTVSSDGAVLTATVLAEDTEDVFGVDYGTDVVFTLSQNNNKIVSMTIQYTLESGENVVAKCSFK